MKSLWRIVCPLGCLVAIATLLECGGSSHNIAPMTITTAALPNGTAGTPYSEQVQASSGVSPYTWALGSGALPQGLQLGPGTGNTVTISGTPDTPVQADAFSVKVTDSASQSANQPYLVSIPGITRHLGSVPRKPDIQPPVVGNHQCNGDRDAEQLRQQCGSN